MSASTLRIGVLMPEVLGTYGDTGNALILAERARRRGIDAEVVHVGLTEEIPDSLDIYTLGGGEDTAQALAADKFRGTSGLARALDAGRPLLAICASLQVLGHWYEDARGARVTGMGVLDITTLPQGHRAIGELVTVPLVEGLTQPLSGFENHGGGTVLGEDAAPLGRVISGVGTGTRRARNPPRSPTTVPSRDPSSPPTCTARPWLVTPSWRTCYSSARPACRCRPSRFPALRSCARSA